MIERRSRLGIELIDALTGAPVVTASRVNVGGAEVLHATGSRWFVEDALPATVIVVVDAEGYVSEAVSIALPAGDDPAPLVEVRLKPRTGYPFPPSLTRLVGLVVFDATELPARGAEVTVTPEHGGVAATTLATRTTDDGQFAMWFLPASALAPPLAAGYRVDAQIVVDGITFTGSLSSQPLLPNRRNDAPILRLTP
jgi:hypothetical protein